MPDRARRDRFSSGLPGVLVLPLRSSQRDPGREPNRNPAGLESPACGPYDPPMEASTAESLLELAERAGPGLKGLDARASQAQLEQQYALLLEAIQWFLDQGRTNEALRIA